jgi:hypothetical protein
MENLEMYGVQEMNPVEILETSGGNPVLYEAAKWLLSFAAAYFLTDIIDNGVGGPVGGNPDDYINGYPPYPVCDNV